ncbi:MAG: hydrolase, partial [Ignavibacteria bacterium]|nr:hydrolase [Ignavibacteria bacterium]
MPSNNSGFYSPMELFYSRRIGKKLSGGNEVPLIFGTKAFGRINDWEYGGFLAMTGETDYVDNNGGNQREERAYFGSARIKKQILDNSNIGVLFVGKNSIGKNSGVLDVDGAFRESDWQLAYQVARSFKNSEGDFAASAGFTKQTTNWMTLMRTRYVGNKFDINDVGYVPWKGTATYVGITGPVWFFDQGYISQLELYGGGAFTYEKVDAYTDYSGIIGINMQFRNNWGYEIDYSFGNQKDSKVKYFASELTFSSWFNISPKWNGNLYGGYTKTYNFSRNYLAFYSWAGTYFQWKALSILDIGTSYDMFIEGNPEGNVEEITYNARPFVTITPMNDLRVRVYLDNVFVKSSDKLEQVIFGFL